MIFGSSLFSTFSRLATMKEGFSAASEVTCRTTECAVSAWPTRMTRSSLPSNSIVSLVSN
jgi:hypothetical protein